MQIATMGQVTNTVAFHKTVFKRLNKIKTIAATTEWSYADFCSQIY